MAGILAGGGLRTVWISLRAINYTQKVFDDVIKNTNLMMQAETNAASATKNLTDMATHFVIAGAMMSVLALQLGGQLWNLAMSSQEGASQMAALQKNIDLTKGALADTIYEILQATGILNLLNTVLTYIQENKWAQYLIIGLAGVVIVGLAVAGMLLLLTGLMIMSTVAGANLSTMTGVLTMLFGNLTIAGIPLNIVLANLAASMLAVGAAFMIFMALKDITGPIAAAIIAISALAVALWGLFVAESASSFGIAAAVGGAAAAAAYGISQVYGHFQEGTRAVPYTGPVFAHKGEIIYNPSTNRPLQVGNDLAGGGGQTVNESVSVNIENVHTKAEFDDVDDQVRKALRKNMRNRR